MTAFVSYSRRDNPEDSLRGIERTLANFDHIYVDDIHYPANTNRLNAVHLALNQATVFICVISENYLETPWTSFELGIAEERRLRVLCLLPDGSLIASSPNEVRRMQGVSVVVRKE